MNKNSFADGFAYIEGKYFPIAEARIPILDTGFTRSDVTYDVVAVWNGTLFRLEDHLKRYREAHDEERWTMPADYPNTDDLPKE